MRNLILFALLTLTACNRWGGLQTSDSSQRIAADRGTVAPITVGGTVQSYADVVDRASPAVVTIRSARRVRAPQQFPFMEDPFFRRFFGDRPNAPSRNQSSVERALGSGVIATSDGHILTNHHVVDGAEQITVELANGRTYSAKLIGSDPPSDLALLQISATGLPTLTLGNSDQVRVGDICLAVGNPLGVGETVTAGIVSAKGRATGLSDGAFEDFLQTDAPINQGNSGGALINTRAELIGINSQILSPSGGNIGIGFAIPSNMAKAVMAQLTNGGKVRRGQLGVGIQSLTSEIATSLGMKEIGGVLINSVTPGGPADQAGVKTGDVIRALNGQSTNNPNELRNRIAGASPGTQVTLKLYRDGAERDLKVTLGELTPGEAAADKLRPSGEPGASTGQLGLNIQPLTPADAGQLGLPKNVVGVLVESVNPDGPAAEAGITEGDVIVEVNRRPVRTTDDMRSALRRTGSDSALLLINRRGQTIYVAVRPV